MTIESEPEWHFNNDPSVYEKIMYRFRERLIITVHLKWVAVETRYHRQGIGRLLMGRAFDDFKEVVDRTGVPALTLKPISTAAAKFYESLGFVPYGQENPRRMYFSAEAVLTSK